MDKCCPKCQTVKDVSEFYKAKSRRDGLQYWCKDCTREDSALRNRTPAMKEIKGRYGKSDRGRESAHRYSISKKGRLASRISSAKDQILHPDRVASRQAARQSVRSGILVPQSCMVCGNPKSQMHHDDYSKPLEVKWFCITHHWGHHMENASG